MRGIAGWVSFDSDLRHHRARVQATTGTMACRGPDDEGRYLREHVAPGHRRLAVVDLDAGREAPRNVQDRLLFVDRWLREYDVDVAR